MNLRRKRAPRVTASKKAELGQAQGSCAFDRLFALATYEAQHDPYRGMLSADSPWNQCQWVAELPPDEEGNNTTSVGKVFRTCHCTCPSLTLWTQQNDDFMSKKKRKRVSKAAVTETNIDKQQPRLGRRQGFSDDGDDEEYYSKKIVCACDYNPLCLASLGGIMDDILAEAAANVLSNDLDENSIEENSTPKQPEIVNVDEDDDDNDEYVKRAKLAPETTIIETLTASTSIQTPPGTEESTPPDVSHMDSSNEKVVYSKGTTEQLKECRRACEVDLRDIHSYVSQTILPDDIKAASVYIGKLRKWNESVLFVNPLVTTVPHKDSTLTLAIPPGIRNLGATCYLNTQLQCLARNVAFVEGIFSWRPSQDGKNHVVMNSVLSTMQLLLARMVHGAEAILTTHDFSHALGLENDEMQDPNEFARLLFERMHESFEQCSKQQNSTPSNHQEQDLSTLLPRLFHGKSMYATTCLTCKQVSERSEGFMDLNLPIVKPPGEGGVQEAFSSSDTHVQYCLDQYTCAEELSGDNQYWCETCQCKRDARRAVYFQELPPVLNVQLSRYVFDRTKCMKKKLMDKVLLPRFLNVPIKGKEETIAYILCAVMKHSGTSAYQGHYVAEAMDWHSGTWFEFNDEKVKILENGPNCSYIPKELDAGSDDNWKKRSVGSSDAYNMYYVRRPFLAQCAINSIMNDGHDENSFLPIGKADANRQTDVLGTVARERKERYCLLAEMCINDGKASVSISRRRTGLRSGFAPLLKDSTGMISYKNSHLPSVWVDRNPLRQFLSCKRGTSVDEGSINQGPVLRHKHLLCEHGVGLHPRIARRGKLLPRALYDAYVRLLLGEQQLRKNKETGENDDVCIDLNAHEANDCEISPESNMYCGDCVASYREELLLKLETLNNLKLLYDALDQKKEALSLDTPDDESEASGCDEFVYLVSRKFITNYRSLVGSLLKSLEGSEVQSVNSKLTIIPGTESIGEGLDAIDVTCLMFDRTDGPSTGEKEANDVQLDYFVNSNITCKHGQCNVANNKRLVRYVSEGVWNSLRAIFPGAVPHRRKRNPSLPELAASTIETGRCPHCQHEELTREEFAKQLQSWSLETSSSVSSNVFKSRRSLEEVISMLNSSTHASDMYLVHHSDMNAWRRALSEARTESKKDCFSARKKIEALLFPHRRSIGLNGNMEPFYDEIGEPCTLEGVNEIDMHRNGWRPRSIICPTHRLTIRSGLFSTGDTSTHMPSNWVSQLNNGVEAITRAEYVTYVRSIYNLGMFLFASDSESISCFPDPVTSIVSSLMSTHHPKIHSLLSVAETESSLALEDNTPELSIFPQLCNDPSCNRAFEDDLTMANTAVSGQELDGKSAERAVNSTARSGILQKLDTVDGIEMPVSHSFPLRVFEIQRETSPAEALSHILRQTGFGIQPRDTDNGIVRRSSRKRKGTFPSGPILRDDELNVQLHHNVAALRLFMYEKCLDFRIDEKLTIVIQSSTEVDADGINCNVDMATEHDCEERQAEQDYTFIELPYDWNNRSLEEILLDFPDCKSCDAFALSNRILLCRQTQGGDEVHESRKRQDEEIRMANESLLDSLLEMENTVSDLPSTSNAPGASDSQRKSRRRAERGFRGTLLHSSSTAPSSSPTSNDDKQDEPKTEMITDTLRSTPARSSDLGNIANEDLLDKPHANLTEVHGTERGCSPCEIFILDESDHEQVNNQGGIPKSPNVGGYNSPAPLLNNEASDRIVGQPQLQLPIGERRKHICFRNDRMYETLLNKVIEALKGDNVVPIHSKCQEAVRWARMESAKHANIGRISHVVDMAFAKYLDLSTTE